MYYRIYLPCVLDEIFLCDIKKNSIKNFQLKTLVCVVFIGFVSYAVVNWNPHLFFPDTMLAPEPRVQLHFIHVC